MSRLTKINLNSNANDQFVYVDISKITSIHVQLPLTSNLVSLVEEKQLGIVRIFVVDMPAPFQFTRTSREEIDEVLAQLLE